MVLVLAITAGAFTSVFEASAKIALSKTVSLGTAIWNLQVTGWHEEWLLNNVGLFTRHQVKSLFHLKLRSSYSFSVRDDLLGRHICCWLTNKDST